MSTPDDKTLQIYKDNLLGGHLLKDGNETAKQYWASMIEACNKTDDGKPDIGHFKELTGFDTAEAAIGLCRLESMELPDHGKLMPQPQKQDTFKISKNDALFIAVGSVAAFVTAALRRA